MKKVFALIIIAINLHALTPKEAYHKALMYEKNGDEKMAMKWYKKSASLALHEQNPTKTEELPVYVKDEVKSYEKVTSKYQEYFSPFENKQTEQTVGQILTGIFGLQPYHTNYLLPVVYAKAGHKNRKHYETQFQISFKKTMFSNLLGFDENYAFGYSQTSWWQTFKESKPFRETNYRPEIFVYGFYGDRNSSLKGYQLGLLHESNGMDFERSRSWNRLYLSTFWQFGNFFVVPRVWYRFPERTKRSVNDEGGDDNPDIEDYLGYGDLTVALPWRSHVFKAKLRNNLKLNSNNRGAFELEWTFPLWSKNFFGYVNYFTGYGRSLEDYNTHDDRIGIGFALSR